MAKEHPTNYTFVTLSGLTQSVKSDNLLSQPLAISKGVPQGSILAPSLFSIYMNNKSYSVGNASIYFYADRTALSSVGPSVGFLSPSCRPMSRPGLAPFIGIAPPSQHLPSFPWSRWTVLPSFDYDDVLYRSTS